MRMRARRIVPLIACLLAIGASMAAVANSQEATVKMWVPNIALLKQPAGTYVLLSSTLVPSPCYESAGTEEGMPKGQVAVPEALPIQLKIKKRGGPILCMQVPITLVHRRDGLKLDGKQSVVAFSILGGEVKGSSSASGKGAETLKTQDGGGEIPTPF